MVAHSQLAPLPIDLPFRVISSTIGQGAYACIKKAVPLDSANPVFAVKFINKDYAIRHGRLSKRQLDIEASLHAHLGRHENIVQFYRMGDDVNWRWIAMELAEGGDLFDKIESDVGVGEDIAHLYFTQLISAVEYMHRKKVSHRDIKPENILLSTEGYLKIADFGLAALFEYKGQRKLCTSSCGSPPYTAPEVVTFDHAQKKKLDAGYEGNLVDIWSSAVVLFVLLVGNTPWDEPLERNDEFHDYLMTIEGCPDDELWHRIPPAALPLIRGMMHVDPHRRWQLDDIMQDAWFQRPNPYLSTSRRLTNPIGVATEMFESMKIDFSQPLTSMDSDTSSTHKKMYQQEPLRPRQQALSNDVGQHEDPQPTYDFHSQGQGYGQDMEISSQAAIQDNISSWDERLAEEASCSQFSCTPRVPMTRTQFAREFHQILPSQTLARFFSFWPVSNLIETLEQGLRRLMATHTVPNHENRKVNTMVQLSDSRHCILRGTIVVERISGAHGDVLEVVFLRTLGDPVEWRRFFKKMVIACRAAVFCPDDSINQCSQMGVT